MADPLPKYARVDTQNPEGWAVCDRCQFWRNRGDLTWQYEWAGNGLYNKQILVCVDRCYDTPQEQFRTIVLPPDPPPIVNARVPNFAYEEYMAIQLQRGASNLPPWGAGPNLELVDQTGTFVLTFQYTNTQSSDPS